jgi:predicted phage replisome organizer
VAEIKWIKLTTDMFDNRKIKHLRRLPEGNNIVLIWVMLLTMAGRCNSGGMIFLTENIPYTPKMLADELDFEENTVQLALQALEQLSMVVINQGYFSIAGWEEYQNIEGMEKIREQNRLRQKKWYDKQKELPNVTPNVRITQPNATEEDIDRDIEGEKKKENTLTLFRRLVSDYSFDSEDELYIKIEEWVKYKMERREPYKEQGMKALLRQIENNAIAYGDSAVCELIEESMSNGWKGIIFDRLKQKPTRQSSYTDKIQNRVSDVDNW